MGWKKEKLRSILKINKERLIFLFCSGLLLFLLAIPNDGPKAKETVTAGSAADGKNAKNENISSEVSAAGDTSSSYEKELEERIRGILKNVDGVGEVDVMVMLKSSEEKVYHVDKTTSSSVNQGGGTGDAERAESSESLSENTVMDGQTSSPVVEKSICPEISGIIISADGGGSAVVKTEISEAMEALLGLPANKVKVLKRVK
jgi:stage III sporulation protein AG